MSTRTATAIRLSPNRSEKIREEIAVIHGADTVSTGGVMFQNTTVNTEESNLVM